MKKFYLRFLLLLTPLVCSERSSYAQAVVCPSLAANSATLNCSTPCATLNVTPSVNLQATTSYSVAAVTYAPFSYATGTNATFAGAGWSSGTDDSYGDIVNLPFNFCFFGTSYNKIVIGTLKTGRDQRSFLLVFAINGISSKKITEEMEYRCSNRSLPSKYQEMTKCQHITLNEVMEGKCSQYVFEQFPVTSAIFESKERSWPILNANDVLKIQREMWRE